MSEGLKPCPFCGGCASIRCKTREYAYARCTRCGAESEHLPDKAHAAAAWNLRTDHLAYARSILASVGEQMTEHAYQELTAALEES